MTTVEEIISWILENSCNIEDRDGNKHIAINWEEIRMRFNDWRKKEKQQIVAFNQWLDENHTSFVIPDMIIQDYINNCE